MPTNQDLQQYLQERGHSYTRSRQQVFSAIHQHHRLGLPALIHACSAVDRATVYRTIDLFEQLGIIHRVQNGWHYDIELSDVFGRHHHHITCVSCGLVSDIPAHLELESTIAALANQAGFLPVSHQLEIMARCQNCQTKIRSN